MNPRQPNTKLTQPSPSHQTRQKTPIIINIDSDSSTESESDQNDTSIESQPDTYHSAYGQLPPENQLGLKDWEDWKLRRSRLRDIPEVSEPTGKSQLFDETHPMFTPNLEKIDCGVQVKIEPVEKDDIPVNAKMFSSSNGQVSIFV